MSHGNGRMYTAFFALDAFSTSIKKMRTSYLLNSQNFYLILVVVWSLGYCFVLDRKKDQLFKLIAKENARLRIIKKIEI